MCQVPDWLCEDYADQADITDEKMNHSVRAAYRALPPVGIASEAIQ